MVVVTAGTPTGRLIPDHGAVTVPLPDGRMITEAVDDVGERFFLVWQTVERTATTVELVGGTVEWVVPAHEQTGPLPEPYAVAVERVGKV